MMALAPVMAMVSIIAVVYEPSDNQEHPGWQSRVYFSHSGETLQKVISIGEVLSREFRTGALREIDLSHASLAPKHVERGTWYQPLACVRVQKGPFGFRPQYQLSDESWTTGPLIQDLQKAIDLAIETMACHRAAQDRKPLELPVPDGKTYWPA